MAKKKYVLRSRIGDVKGEIGDVISLEEEFVEENSLLRDGVLELAPVEKSAAKDDGKGDGKGAAAK